MRCSDWLTFRRGADHRGDPAGDRCDLSLQLPRRSTRWAARCAGAQPSDLGDGAPAGARAAGVLRECRALLETYHDLRAEHTAWVQRIHAVFFHQGAPALGDGALRTDRDLSALRAAAAAHLSPAGQLQVATALDMLAALEARLDVLRHRLLAAARSLTGAKVLTERLYGVGPVTGLAMTCWLGGAGRFSSSRKAVRFAGLDVTVWSSDRKGPPGRLSWQGPPVLRFSSALAVSGGTRVAVGLPC